MIRTVFIKSIPRVMHCIGRLFHLLHSRLPSYIKISSSNRIYTKITFKIGNSICLLIFFWMLPLQEMLSAHHFLQQARVETCPHQYKVIKRSLTPRFQIWYFFIKSTTLATCNTNANECKQTQLAISSRHNQSRLL